MKYNLLLSVDVRLIFISLTNFQISPYRGVSEQLLGCSSSGPSNQANTTTSSPVKNTYPNQTIISPVKPGPLPPNLDDLKVSVSR